MDSPTYFVQLETVTGLKHDLSARYRIGHFIIIILYLNLTDAE